MIVNKPFDAKRASIFCQETFSEHKNIDHIQIIFAYKNSDELGYYAAIPMDEPEPRSKPIDDISELRKLADTLEKFYQTTQ